MPTHSKNFISGENFRPEAPKPTKIVYEVIVSHLVANCQNTEAHLVLNDVYKSLAENEQVAVVALDRLEAQGIITREDALILSVLLAVSRTLGPDLTFVREAVLFSNLVPEVLAEKIAKIDLDPQIKMYLENILNRINTKAVR